jgi:hypothetical protein
VWLSSRACTRAVAQFLEKRRPNCFIRTRLALAFAQANLPIRERRTDSHPARELSSE